MIHLAYLFIVTGLSVNIGFREKTAPILLWASLKVCVRAQAAHRLSSLSMPQTFIISVSYATGSGENYIVFMLFDLHRPFVLRASWTTVEDVTTTVWDKQLTRLIVVVNVPFK